jgi:hypothetical protein
METSGRTKHQHPNTIDIMDTGCPDPPAEQIATNSQYIAALQAQTRKGGAASLRDFVHLKSKNNQHTT